ncbi:MAG: permease [Pseudomonadales bacterium]
MADEKNTCCSNTAKIHSCSSTQPAKPTCCAGKAEQETRCDSSQQAATKKIEPSCCNTDSKKIDVLLWSTSLIIALLYGLHLLLPETTASIPYLNKASHSVFELMNTLWWGILLGMLMVGILSHIPREFVISMMGKGGTLSGLVRATLAGVLLDLCSHGILMVGAKLYERGVSAGQVMAFLIASPWNSFSLTIILIVLIGLKWTLAFILLSVLIALLTGFVFDRLVASKRLPGNPNQCDIPEDFQFWPQAKARLADFNLNGAFIRSVGEHALSDSKMVIRWIFLGVIFAAALRTFLDPQVFEAWFGPTLVGLGLTVLVATILEVCSEGSAPLAADLLNRAGSPGNSFAFLMSGVATDYTEIMVVRQATASWKIALFLPLISVPQIVLIAWLINVAG